MRCREDYPNLPGRIPLDRSLLPSALEMDMGRKYGTVVHVPIAEGSTGYCRITTIPEPGTQNVISVYYRYFWTAGSGVGTEKVGNRTRQVT